MQRAVLLPMAAIAGALFLATLAGTWINGNRTDAIESRSRPITGRVVAVDVVTSSPPSKGLVAYDVDGTRTAELEITDAEATGEVPIELEYDPDQPDLVWRAGEHPWVDQWWTTPALFFVVAPVALGGGLWLWWHPAKRPELSDATEAQPAT